MSLQFLPAIAVLLVALSPAIVRGQDQVVAEPERYPWIPQWEDDVTALIEGNDDRLAGPNDILIAGSSSVRLWDQIDEDMQPYSMVRRGYGGARYSDLAYYLPRLLANHTPKAVVYFAGNDIAGDEAKDISPSNVADLVESIARYTRKRFPQQPIFVIALSITPKRFAVTEEIRQANQEIAARLEKIPNCYLIPTEDLLVDANGQPREELFRDDRLHLSDAGYDLWAARIKSYLDRHLDRPAAPASTTAPGQ